jgi:hypothetical protein
MCPELVQHYGMREMLAAQMYSAIALVCAVQQATTSIMDCCMVFANLLNFFEGAHKEYFNYSIGMYF